MQNKKPQVNKRVLTNEKLDEIGCQLEQSPKKIFVPISSADRDV